MQTQTTCSECNVQFVYNHLRGKPRTTCSDECKRARRNRLTRERYQSDERYRHHTVARVLEWQRANRSNSYRHCAVCGELFPVFSPLATTCSLECIPEDLDHG